LASFAVKVAALVLIAAPGVTVLISALVLFSRGKDHEGLLTAGLAAYWLLPVAAGARWGACDRSAISRKPSRWLLPVLPVAIAVCIAGVHTALEMLDRAERWQQGQRQLKRDWISSEQRLRACARTLNAAEAKQDAVKSFNLGDSRLLGTYESYQEGSRFHVPVLDVSDEGRGGPASPPSYVEARQGAEKIIRRFHVKVSPKGEIWGDPWGHVTASMGRVPDSEAACTKATEKYARAYNETMLQIVLESASAVPGRKQ
jgi:hypothetical protein